MNIKNALLAITFVLIALPCEADTAVGPEGRQITTGPKFAQQSIDGFDLQLIEEVPRPSARSLTPMGRSLQTGPKQPVSVGLVGCSGCQTEAILEGIRTFTGVPSRE